MTIKANPYLRNYSLNGGNILNVINKFGILLVQLQLIDYQIYSDVYDKAYYIPLGWNI